MKIIEDVRVDLWPLDNGSITINVTTLYRDVTFVRPITNSIYPNTPISSDSCPMIYDHSNNVIDPRDLMYKGFQIELSELRQQSDSKVAILHVPKKRKKLDESDDFV